MNKTFKNDVIVDFLYHGNNFETWNEIITVLKCTTLVTF